MEFFTVCFEQYLILQKLIWDDNSFIVTSSWTKSKDLAEKEHTHYTCVFLRLKGIYRRQIYFWHLWQSAISVFWIFNVYKHWLTDIDVIKFMQIKESPYSWNILIISVPRGKAFLWEDLEKTLLNWVHVTFLGQRAQSKFLSEEKFLLLVFC